MFVFCICASTLTNTQWNQRYSQCHTKMHGAQLLCNIWLSWCKHLTANHYFKPLELLLRSQKPSRLPSSTCEHTVVSISLDRSGWYSGDANAFQLESPGSSPGSDGLYEPLMSSSGSKIWAWCFPSVNLKGWLEVYAWKLESKGQSPIPHTTQK